jgi:aminopeptidase
MVSWGVEDVLTKYANLLVDYCLDIQVNDRLLVQSTYLAEPLVRQIYKQTLVRGGHMVVEFTFSEREKIFMDLAADHQLSWISPLRENAIKEFEAFLHVRAPYNLRENENVDPEKRRKRANALSGLNKIYFERTSQGELKRSLCQFPTQANAQEAGMSLGEYSDFIYRACKLHAPDPKQSWIEVREKQESVVTFLNDVSEVRYLSNGTDISFSVKGRNWINSDGKTNMPSGEVFTSPVEDSVNGRIFFSYPSIYLGKDIEGITLEVKSGEVVRWDAEKGKDHLDSVLKNDGARFFGEVAIGMNYDIDKATKNILFDEKMGGTVHMALGQSYYQTGGKNQSPIHWDMITDMRDGEIWADGQMIYKAGKFII